MITLYSTGCPKCSILEKRLTNDGISFNVSNNIDELINMGFQNAPVLQIGDSFIDYVNAMKLLKVFEEVERDS